MATFEYADQDCKPVFRYFSAKRFENARLMALVKCLGGAETAAMLIEFYERGRSMREIAERHGMSPRTLEKRIAKARKLLTDLQCWPDNWRGVHLRHMEQYGRSAEARKARVSCAQ